MLDSNHVLSNLYLILVTHYILIHIVVGSYRVVVKDLHALGRDREFFGLDNCPLLRQMHIAHVGSQLVVVGLVFIRFRNHVPKGVLAAT